MNYFESNFSIVNNIRITWRLFLEFSLVLMITSLLYPSITFGYKTDVHEKITSYAINKSSLILDDIMPQIGFIGGVDEVISSWEDYPIREWIQYGSKWEDYIAFDYIPWFSSQGPLYNHFFNPLYNIGYYELENGVRVEKGESLIFHMNNYIINDAYWLEKNEWAYQMARELYYAALTGDSSKFQTWQMRDRFTLVWDPIVGKASMHHAEREKFFAWTFQALGHIVHLIQDASVPAHTRNDLHTSDPFEVWTAKNIANENLMNYKGDGSNSWQNWENYPGIPAQNAFIDTKPYPENSPARDSITQTEGFEQGLAEYSHANFLSQDSIHSYSLPDLSGAVFVEFDPIIQRNRVYLQSNNFSNGGVKHLALCGFLYHFEDPNVLTSGTYSKTAFTIDDAKIHEDYAAKLVPRAVGYSAGFLDYFFRGTIKITDPNLDFNPAIGGFDFVTLYAENISAEGEDMTGGSISLVVKYKIDEKDQYLTVPSGPKDEHDEFQYVVKKLEQNHSIPRTTDEMSDPVEFQFDLSGNPIPLNAKEIHLYLVYRGDLGAEKDDAVAVGYKDLSPRNIEIKVPNSGIYAISSADPSSVDPRVEGFDRVALLAQNVSSDNRQMDGGSLQLVVKYRAAQQDQFQNSAPFPPYGFQYIVKDFGNNISIPRDTPDLFEFDLSTEQIPLWATDVYLYLIYKGKLGSENMALGVGFKDISEPTFVDFYNSMDKICLQGQYFDAGSAAAIAMVDADNNGIADTDEWDVYSHDLQNMYIRFTTEENPQVVSASAYDQVIPYLAAGEFARLFILTDNKFVFSSTLGERTNINPADGFDHFGNDVGGMWIADAITNQVKVLQPGDPGYDSNSISYIRWIPYFYKFRDINNARILIYIKADEYPVGSICNFE
jgi:hypothetical protein